jgi:hypothetical protein
MNIRSLTALLFIPFSASATTPPQDVPFETTVCMATHIFIGTASDFKVVPISGCDTRGDRNHLSMCEEVQVSVAVSEVITPVGWKPAAPVIFRFGGGFFSVPNLRNDLLGKPRYFITKQSPDGVFRTSYGWNLGTEAIPEAEKLITEALGTCVAPKNSFKPTLLHKAA